MFSNNGREGRGGLPYLPVVARELLVGHDQSLLDRLRGHRDRRSLRLRLPLAREHTTSRRAAAGSREKPRRSDCSPRAARAFSQLAEELPGYVNQEAHVQPGEVGGALDALYAKKGVSERGGPAHVVGRERATK